MTLTTTQKSIDALLTGDRQYQIPDFQRSCVTWRASVPGCTATSVNA